jgi:WD40 repeat protein
VLAFEGHKDQIIALAWSNVRKLLEISHFCKSRSNLVLSASLDNTVRLWSLRNKDSVAVFDHPDVVTAVDMHPKVFNGNA